MKKSLKALVLLGCFVVSCVIYFHLYTVMIEDFAQETTKGMTHGQMADSDSADCERDVRHSDLL